MSSEITTAWQRSSFCADGNCVEVARVGGGFALRDSKDVALEPMRFTADDWRKFVDFVAAQYAEYR